MKLKKINKLLSIMLAATMCLAVCACGQEDTTGSSSSDDTSVVEESTNSGEGQKEEAKMYWELLDEVADSSELPDWEGETLEVSIWVAGGTDTVLGTISEDDVCFKELERVTGIRFALDDSYGNGGETIDAKLPKMVAGKDFPTMVFSYGTPSQMRQLYDNGYLVNLTPYYEDGTLDQVQKYLPTDIFAETAYANMKTEDDQYYMLPMGLDDYVLLQYWDAAGFQPEGYDPDYINACVNEPTHVNGLYANNAIAVRDDILKALYPDALTMADIQKIWVEEGTFTEEQIFDIQLKTKEDFFDLLYDIQELLKSGEYKGLDGKPMEVTYGPNSETDNWNWMTYLPAYLEPMATQTNYFSMFDANETDSTKFIKSAWETDYMQSFMKSFNKLVNDDVIAQNSLVDNATAFTEKMNNGHYAVLYGGKSGGQKVTGPEGEWTYRTIWVEEAVSDDYNTLFVPSQIRYWGIFADSVTDEQLEQLLHAYNYMWSEVGGKAMTWGPASAGLFEEDANGLRHFIDPELADNILYGVDNEVGYKYGIKDAICSTKTVFAECFYGPTAYLYSPRVMLAQEKERNAAEAYNYFIPGIIGGEWNYATNGKQTADVNYNLHGFGITNVESLSTFWAARSGFENQMKKVIAASPEDYDAEMKKLKEYCLENGWTDQAMLEFNEKWVAANEKSLKAAGYLK